MAAKKGPKKPQLTSKRLVSVLTNRRLISVRLTTGAKAPPSIHALYEETWIEKNELVTRITHGHSIRTVPGFADLNPRNKKEAERNKEELRPELFTIIQAIALLMADLERECLHLDEKRGMKQI